MSAYLQSIAKYNRYVKDTQIHKTANYPAYPGYLQEGEQGWTDQQVVNHFYHLTEPATRASIDQVVRQNGAISPTHLIMLAGASSEKNLALWAALARAGLDEHNGHRAKLFSAPSASGLRAAAAHSTGTLARSNALDQWQLSTGATLQHWFPQGDMLMSDKRLGALVRNKLLTSGAHTPAGVPDSVKNSHKSPTASSHAITGAAIGTPIALGGILLKRPKLGLLGLGLATAASTAYGLARNNGWKGWEPANALFDKADSINPLVKKD